MILSFLLLSWLLCSIAGIQLNLYNIDHTLDINYEHVTCLHYYNRDAFRITEKTEYCLGPISSNYSWGDDFLKKHVHFTFDQLRQLNVTANKLLSWSATIDLAEKYQYYIDHHQVNSFESKEIFFNCSKPWFGPRCQYSFDLNKTDSFRAIVQQTLKKKLEYDSSYSMTNLTCYNHLKCDRGGSGMCLDWREVCDGRIDCIDEGADEAQCFDLEVNECNETEYRCHNGQCIPQEFLEDDAPQCLDKSDISDAFFYRHKSQFPYLLDYEDHLCRPGQEQFVCGNGQCVADFDACKNKRHLLLIESISVQGNLSDICWMTMICLTKILDQVNGTSCDQFLKLSDIDTYLQTCKEDLIQFPSVPVLFGHVRFLYHVKSIRGLNISLSLIPDYICYDEQLCDFLTSTYRNGTYSCRQSHEFNFDWNMKSKSWASVIRLVERYFRKCMVRYNNNKKNYSNHSFLHCCKNSSKCISKHRILDGVSDCYLNDDEEAFELSCKVNDVLRFKCPNENKCYSSSVSRDICSPVRLLNFDEIEFRKICDRHVEMFPLLIAGQKHTDETDCERWPCSNFYTRCDGFWSCSDGRDEENCTQKICPSGHLPCVTPYNYTFICLLANRVNDGHIDCLGAVDELQHCRSANQLDRSYSGFRCLNDTKCITASDLCNTEQHCPSKDDEDFCGDHRDICNQMKVVKLTDVEKAICLTHSVRRIQFSIETSTKYPLLSVNQTIQRSIQPHTIQNLIYDEINDSEWLWYCNRGLYVRHWLGGSNFSYRCFCPPSYYGDKCQYQNERVSLTVQLRVMNIHTVYAVIITLIDDDDNRQEIISFQQYTSISIARYEDNFNAYLTYEVRPKRNSTKYSVRVDVFNKISLTYLASWYFVIPFSFLPVNRMAILLHVPAQSLFCPINCSLTCYHGQCMKYMNKEKLFCRCHVGWSGVQCNISVRCNDCSLDSICIGAIHNRAICVCPLHKRGPRCLLMLSNLEGACLNNGQYLALDDSMHDDVGFACICSKEYHGQFCDKQNSKLEISLRNMEIPSFLLIYIFTFDLGEDAQQMVPRIIPQKLAMFQRTVLIYTEIPTRMAFVKIENSYYLAVLQHSKHKNISTSIDSNQRCEPITGLLSTELLALPEIHRIKYYHTICQTHIDVKCFTDELYMCLCTIERHANCFRFQSFPPKCSQDNYCMNGAECFQDYRINPSTIMCICPECFFGSRCQFYAKSIGLTLDDILRYEIQPNTSIYDQKSIVKWSATLTMIMFGVGLISSVLSILAFLNKEARKMGCGIYLLASSITSLLTTSILTVKFWFLVLIQTNSSVSRSVLRGECISFEFILKVCLYTENWLSACVAIERSVCTYKTMNFNKMLSKRVARWIIIILPLSIMASFVHELLYRTLFDDIEEQRFWCVLYYSRPIHMYNTVIVLFHSIGPICINIFSIWFISFYVARLRNDAQTEYTYSQHVFQQFMMSKQIFIGPIVLLVATVPRLMMSLPSGCIKMSYNVWLYLSGYFVSFIPSVTIFFVFVLPSDVYRRRLKHLMKFCRRRNR